MRFFTKYKNLRWTTAIITIACCCLVLAWGLYFFVYVRSSGQVAVQTNQIAQESTSTATTNGPPKNPTPAEQKIAAAALAGLKCPEDYQTEDEIIKAFGEFYYDYSVVHPDANGNIKLLTPARVDFLISHNCTQTLVNMGYSGTGPITPAIRQKIIDSDLKAAGF